MNERQALYITTIAHEGGILAASKLLHVSQPSLSQMLRQVETELGVRLFDRSAQPLRPTNAGERYLHAAAVILRANETLANELCEIRQEVRGTLRLGISMQRGAQLLPQLLPAFFRDLPTVELRLTEAGSADLERLLEENRIDLALASTAPVKRDLAYELLQRETIGLLAGHGSRLVQTLPTGTPIALSAVQGASFVSLKRGHNSRAIQDAVFYEHDVQPQIILETDSMETAIRVTLECGCYMVCADWHADGHGSFYPIAGYQNDRHFYAVMRRDRALPHYARELIERIRSLLA